MFSGIPTFLLKFITRLADRWPLFARLLNRFAINAVVNQCRHRPHPWSTVHNYVSWVSLTDKSWSARHLPPKPQNGLPEPQDLVDLFKRKQNKQQLSDKSTCLFPAFAQYLTDGFIRTRMPNASAGETDDPIRKQNTSNHEIDLCTLYGRTQEQTDQLRLQSNEPGQRGRLKSQDIDGEQWSPFFYQEDGKTPKEEFSALDLPLGIDKFPQPEIRANIFAVGGDRVNSVPQVMMINTLLLREHNRLAGEIEASCPSWDDERVFQTARNTLIVLFIKIVVEEYINHISPTPFSFKADPAVAWNAPWNKPNWITTEFSLLYRWHSLIPDEITWNGISYPADHTFMNNGFLLETGLGSALREISSQPAAKLGPFNTHDALLGVEQKAVEQGRLVELAPYADYCKYVGLSKPRSFSDISRNPETIEYLSSKYDSPDQVDFYIGMFAEENLPNSAVPPLILRMVAVDAFSQALTNPLLSKHVFNKETFSSVGWQAIQGTHTLADLALRNCANIKEAGAIRMTLPEWQYQWDRN